MLKLPPEVRVRLKRPLGELFPNTAEAVERLRQHPPARLIAVGDVVTAELLAAGLKPDIVIVDFKVMRAPVSDEVKKVIDAYRVRTVKVKNPAGMISLELRRALEGASPPLKLIVEGEENLATLPAVLSAPIGSVIAYGQPREGVVLVEVTEQKRREFQGLFKLFEQA